MIKEASFEGYFRDKVRKAGGRAFKWVCPGVSGVPDRIVLFPGGRIVFAEIKRPGIADGRNARQKKMSSVLSGLGFRVYRIGSKEEIEGMLNEIRTL